MTNRISPMLFMEINNILGLSLHVTKKKVLSGLVVSKFGI